MAGNTATICMQTFRADWCQHLPIATLCERYTITKDQVVRLRTVWTLPLRNDRRLRAKPPRYADPTQREIAERCAAVQRTWDADTEERRRVGKTQHFFLPVVEVPPGLGIYEEGADC